MKYLLAAMFFICATHLTHAETTILDRLPETTLVYVEIGGFERVKQSIEELPLYQLWNDPSLSDFREQLDEQEGNIEEWILGNYGIDFGLMEGKQIGTMVVAGFRAPDGSLTLSLFAELPDSGAAEELMAATTERLEKKYEHAATEIVEGSKTFTVDPESGEDVTLFVRENVIQVHGHQEIAKRLHQRWVSANASGLKDKPGFGEALSAVEDAEPSPIRWYIDPIPLAVILDQEDKEEEEDNDETDRPPFPMRHGFPGLKAIAGSVRFDDPKWHYLMRVNLFAPPPRNGAMQIFDFPASHSQPMRGFIPSSASVLTEVNWNLTSLINNLEDVYDDVTDAEGAFQETLDDYKNGLRVDLKNDIFANIGPEIVSFSEYDAANSVEAMVLSIEIKNPTRNERLVAAAIYKILLEDTETVRRRIPGQRYDLWQMGLTTGDGSMPFSKAGIMVADGRLWISTHASTLEKTLAQKNDSPLAENVDFKNAQAAVAEFITDSDFFNSFSRTDKDVNYTYKVLRENGIQGLEDAENLYSALLLEFLKETDVDFSKLPEFDVIQKYFGIACTRGRLTDTGWEFVIGEIR